MVIPFPRRTRRRPHRLAWTAAWLAAGAVALSGVFIAGQDLLVAQDNTDITGPESLAEVRAFKQEMKAAAKARKN